MANSVPGTALVHTGKVTHCCGGHQDGGDWFSCCDVSSCTPCCPDCPNCPGPVRAEYFNQDWAAIADITRASLSAASRQLDQP